MERRVDCALYDRCLADACTRGTSGFDCHGCRRYQETGARWGDGSQFYKLLLAIFYPETYAEYRREERAHLASDKGDDGTWQHPQI